MSSASASVPAPAPASSENQLPANPDTSPEPPPISANTIALPATASPVTADPADEHDEELRTRLRHRRLELDHEIEEFKLRRDAEYRRFEASLWSEARIRRKSTCSDSNKAQASDTDATAAGAEINNSKDASQAPTTFKLTPLQGTSNDTCHKATISTLEESLSKDKNPPFEKELQVAGLFTPRYLPLLEDRRREHPPPLSTSAMDSDAVDNASGSSEDSGGPRGGSPGHPLASSLKSSSGSYFDMLGKRPGRKPKSPKKVTFQFEDENSVPSRSSPPSTRIVWNIGGIEVDDDDYEEIEDGEGSEELYIESVVDGRGFEYNDVALDDDWGILEQVEDVAITASPFANPGLKNLGELSRTRGDDLVTPMMSGTEIVDHGNSGSGGPGPTTMPPGSMDASAETWTSKLNSNTANSMEMNGDYDDEGLFDLDETIPDESPQTPPHRDLSPLIEASQQLPTNEYNFPSASYAAAVPLPGSAPAFNLVSFGKSPVAAAASRLHNASAFSSSFTHTPLRTNGRPPIQPRPSIASSVPASSRWSFTSRPDNSKFRRRSVNKYIPSPPPEDPERSIEPIPEGDTTIAYGSSLPMTITPRLSSLRSPPPSTSPVQNPTAAAISEEEPLGTRPSPQEGPTAFLLIDSSAEELAASPPLSRNSSEVDSYMRTARFPSANVGGGLMSPYRTKFAQELANQVLRDGGDNAGETIVGGVDGKTGFDPESFSVRGRNSSFISPSANLKNTGWSLSARLAAEDEIAETGGNNGGGFRDM